MPRWWFVDVVLFPQSHVFPSSPGLHEAWWKVWDNIIFGAVPYGALRLVRDSEGGNLDRLMVHSCAVTMVCQLITVECVSVSFHIILHVQTNVSVCWPSVSARLQFSETRRESTDISCHVRGITQQELDRRCSLKQIREILMKLERCLLNLIKSERQGWRFHTFLPSKFRSRRATTIC